MIYAKMCIGNYWIKKYQEEINKFGKENTLHILTDNPESFEYGISHMYDRDVFSYYEKINFILYLSKRYNQRVTYIDSDWIGSLNTNLKLDKANLYTYKVFDLTESSYEKILSPSEHELKNKLLLEIESDGIINSFIGEALISIPVHEKIDDMINDSEKLQKKIESNYNKNTKTRKELDKYKHGIGYSEGWGITALCIKYQIPIKEISWRKTTLI